MWAQVGGNIMTKLRATAMTTGALVMTAATVLLSDSAAYAGRSGPNAFYFVGSCTGLGPVTLVNAAPASSNNAAQVVGTPSVIVVASNGAPGLSAVAERAGTTCTITAAGFAGDIQPIPEPFTFAALIR